MTQCQIESLNIRSILGFFRKVLGCTLDKPLLDRHQTTVPTFFDHLQIHIALSREVFGSCMTRGGQFIRGHTHALVVPTMDQLFQTNEYTGGTGIGARTHRTMEPELGVRCKGNKNP